MAHLIDKDTLVVEIKRRLDGLYDHLPDAGEVENGNITISEACNTGKYVALESFEKFIENLEVKEVDLEKTLTGFMGRYAYENGGEYPSAIEIAKYFFELGLKA